jgi:hypothetical protein
MSIELILLFGIALLASGNLYASISLLLRKSAIVPHATVSQPQPVPASLLASLSALTQPAGKNTILTSAPPALAANTRECAVCYRVVARYNANGVCANCAPPK